MSLDTWKAEFYPIEACNLIEADDVTALRHALLKWTGLLPENLSKYDLEVVRGNVVCLLDLEQFFPINAETCVLCIKYIDHNKSCPECPLRDSKKLQEEGIGCDEPYLSLILGRDPKPMIEVIKKALQKLEEPHQIKEGETDRKFLFSMDGLRQQMAESMILPLELLDGQTRRTRTEVEIMERNYWTTILTWLKNLIKRKKGI